MSIEPQNENPGAGTYENPEALSPRGQYSTSKHRGTSYTKFNPRRSQRFFQFSMNVSMKKISIRDPADMTKSTE